MPTTVLSQLNYEPVLMPGRVVRIEPLQKYGYYVMARNQPVEVLPAIKVNLASFTSTLSAFSNTGNQTTIQTKVTALDMPKMNLGHYRVVALDDVNFSLNQPAAIGRFVNKAGVVNFGRWNTLPFFQRQMWSMLPEIFTFEDVTPPTITAIPTYYRSTAFARLIFFGWRYILEWAPVQDPNQTTPALTIRVEGS